MKDLLKTYAPLVALLIGAFIYWSVGTVGALEETIEELREQNENIVIGLTNNCEAIVEKQGKMIVNKAVDGKREPIKEKDASTSNTP